MSSDIRSVPDQKLSKNEQRTADVVCKLIEQALIPPDQIMFGTRELSVFHSTNTILCILYANSLYSTPLCVTVLYFVILCVIVYLCSYTFD